MKGYLEQKGTPTPDKPVEIKSKLIGKNLFETYEVNGKQYTDNIPKDTLICISKEEFIEYKQQKEEIERLNNIIKELRKMLEHKVEFHKNLDFYEDKELEIQAYYNYVACLQDFDEIVEKYKLGK